MSSPQGGLSICIPIYNKGPLLGRMLESIARQQIENLEVVAVNNGSSDNSLEVLESWKDRLNLRIYTLPRTISAPENWLLALSLGTREFLKLQLGDDLIPDGAVAALMGRLRTDPEVGFVFGDSFPIDGEGKVIRNGVLNDYWTSVNSVRRAMGSARSPADKADVFRRTHLGSSAFGDANSIILRSSLVPVLRQGVNRLSNAFQTWPEYEIYLRLFAAAQAGHVDVTSSYFSYDDETSLSKIHNKDFRRRAHDMPAANIVILLLLDPDLRPMTRELGTFFFLKLLVWHAAKMGLMLVGKR